MIVRMEDWFSESCMTNSLSSGPSICCCGSVWGGTDDGVPVLEMGTSLLVSMLQSSHWLLRVDSWFVADNLCGTSTCAIWVLNSTTLARFCDYEQVKTGILEENKVTRGRLLWVCYQDTNNSCALCLKLRKKNFFLLFYVSGNLHLLSHFKVFMSSSISTDSSFFLRDDEKPSPLLDFSFCHTFISSSTFLFYIDFIELSWYFWQLQIIYFRILFEFFSSGIKWFRCIS